MGSLYFPKRPGTRFCIRNSLGGNDSNADLSELMKRSPKGRALVQRACAMRTCLLKVFYPTIKIGGYITLLQKGLSKSKEMIPTTSSYLLPGALGLNTCTNIYFLHIYSKKIIIYRKEVKMYIVIISYIVVYTIYHHNKASLYGEYIMCHVFS